MIIYCVISTPHWTPKAGSIHLNCDHPKPWGHLSLSLWISVLVSLSVSSPSSLSPPVFPLTYFPAAIRAAQIDLRLSLRGQPHRKCLCNGFYTSAVKADEDPALSEASANAADKPQQEMLSLLLTPPLCHFHWVLSLIQHDDVVFLSLWWIINFKWVKKKKK